MNWKLTLIKSILYRLVALTLAVVIAFIISGDIREAIGSSILIEFVQSLNYFGFESVWNFFYEKRIRERVQQEFRQKEIDLKLTIGMIIDISKEFSEIDTFNPQIYQSFSKFFETALENKELREFHSDILESKHNFEALNQGRDFT